MTSCIGLQGLAQQSLVSEIILGTFAALWVSAFHFLQSPQLSRRLKGLRKEGYSICPARSAAVWGYPVLQWLFTALLRRKCSYSIAQGRQVGVV